MAISVRLVVMLLSLVAQLATEVQGAPTRHYRNTYDFLLKSKGLDHDPFFKDCCQIRNVATLFLNYRTKETGVYDITSVCPNTPYTLPRTTTNRPPSVVQARCDMVNNGGGWLVILRRNANASPLVEFNRMWTEYENGFGNLNTEFWYGLKNIHCLTQTDDVELRVDMKREDGTKIAWTYQTFRVDGPETNYRLSIAGGTGPNSTRMYYNNQRPFSTYDRDSSSSRCAIRQRSGWWFQSCSYVYFTNQHADESGKYRLTGDNGVNYFPEVEMKVRPKFCNVNN